MADPPNNRNAANNNQIATTGGENPPLAIPPIQVQNISIQDNLLPDLGNPNPGSVTPEIQAAQFELMMLDASSNGTLLGKMAEQAFEILDRLANNDYQFPSTRKGMARRNAATYELEPTYSISAQLATLTNMVKNLQRPSSSQEVKTRLSEFETIAMTEGCTTMLNNRLPPKLKDPGSFMIPCTIGNHYVGKALCDLGASIKLMPKYIFQRLGIGKARPTTVMLQLADRSYIQPEGKIEDILVRVDKFIFHADFIVVDCEVDEFASIILGRPFLAMRRTLIGFEKGQLTMRVNEQQVTLNVFKALKRSDNPEECHNVNVIDVELETYRSDHYLTTESKSENFKEQKPNEVASGCNRRDDAGKEGLNKGSIMRIIREDSTKESMVHKGTTKLGTALARKFAQKMPHASASKHAPTSEDKFTTILSPLAQKLDQIDARQMLFMCYVRERDVAMLKIFLENFQNSSTTLAPFPKNLLAPVSDTVAITASQNQGKGHFGEFTRTESLNCFSDLDDSNSATKKS
ncbi:hypothetical protein GQ457_01G016500 [Hibiscus cannabinus]